jgi:hypothetical protein
MNENRRFGINSCRDMLGKLEREISRLEVARTLEDAGDHGTNAAVAAWHLVDWTWSALKENRQILYRITAEAARGQLDDCKFKQWICEDPRCPSLEICQKITNSFKHSIDDEANSNLKQEWVEVYWTGAEGQNLTFTGARGEELSFVNAWLIVDGENKYPALELFKEVHKFWSEFLDRYAIQ